MTIGATAVWRARPSGNNTNGGGYDPGIAGAATDYSRQNAAQASGTLGTASGTTTFTDAGGAFTSAMIGNALFIASGAGFTVGAYFITAFSSSTSVTLDRSPGTGTTAQWKLGGAWADYWTNCGLTNSVPVGGNTVFILGSGTPNPASYTIDYTFNVAVTLVNGTTALPITFANDPSTPGYVAPPGNSGGMPVTKCNASGVFSAASTHNIFAGLYFVAGSAASGGVFQHGFSVYYGCVFDQFGFDVAFIQNANVISVVGCEIFSSVGAGAGSSYGIWTLGFATNNFVGNNIHDCIGGGIETGLPTTISTNIIAKCQGNGVLIDGAGRDAVIINNTIDGCSGNGILVSVGAEQSVIVSNIISNNSQASKFGLNVTGSLTGVIDYNTYYNNTSNYNGISAGPHDTALGSNPYVGQSTENYTLA